MADKTGCDNCIHSEVCKYYHGEMARRNYWGKDFIKELKKLRRELAEKCPEYMMESRRKT